MTLRTTALLMMLGLGGTFLLRTANSVWPALFASLSAARLVASLLLAASLCTLSFFWSVWSSWRGWDSRIERASRVAMMGAALAVLLRLRSVFFLFGGHRWGTVGAMGDLLAFLELVSVLAILWFFYVVHSELAQRLPGTGAALMGAAIFTLGTSLTFLLHVLPAPPRWLAERSWFLVILSIPLGLLAVMGLMRFLISVRRVPGTLTGGETPAGV